jgi:hypothetical protein
MVTNHRPRGFTRGVILGRGPLTYREAVGGFSGFRWVFSGFLGFQFSFGFSLFFLFSFSNKF